MSEADLPTTPLRVVGVFGALTFAQRQKQHVGEWLLTREPGNEFDPNAIAVSVGGQRIGYISGSKARSYAPEIDALGGSLVVAGTQTGITFSVDVPVLQELRKYVAARK